MEELIIGLTIIIGIFSLLFYWLKSYNNSVQQTCAHNLGKDETDNSIIYTCLKCGKQNIYSK